VKNTSVNLVVKIVDEIETTCCRMKVNFIDSVRCVICKQAGSILVLDIWIFVAQVLSYERILWG